MTPPGIDRGDQLRQGHVSPAGDFLQALPECIFETNTRFVAGGHDGALGDQRFHDDTPACCSKCVTSNEKICPALWLAEKNSAALQIPHRACLSLSELTLCIGGAVRLELASPTFDRRSGWYAGWARPCAAIGCGSSFSRGGNAVSALLAHGERGESPRSCGPCGLPQDVPSDKLKLRTGTIVVLRVDGVDRK